MSEGRNEVRTFLSSGLTTLSHAYWTVFLTGVIHSDNVKTYSVGPFVVYLDDFVSDADASHLISIKYEGVNQRSSSTDASVSEHTFEELEVWLAEQGWVDHVRVYCSTNLLING